jgi:predicted lipoprotein with Yx(FWY)xxD motif
VQPATGEIDLMNGVTMRARAVVLTVLTALTLTACGGGGQGTESTPEAGGQTVDGPKVKVADSELGRILVDESGRTLYGFTRDKKKASNCDADCIAVWPALTSSTPASAGDRLDAALLGQTKQAEGVVQVTYGEWPLYYYIGDAVAGDLNGQGIDDEWYVVAPDGKLIQQRP